MFGLDFRGRFQGPVLPLMLTVDWAAKASAMIRLVRDGSLRVCGMSAASVHADRSTNVWSGSLNTVRRELANVGRYLRSRRGRGMEGKAVVRTERLPLLLAVGAVALGGGGERPFSGGRASKKCITFKPGVGEWRG